LNLGFQGVLSTFPQTPDGAKRLCADAAMAPNEASAHISRSRRLARDCERLPETLAGPHLMVFATLMLMNDREILA